MTLTLQIVQFVLIISILVILHEMGHFFPAKYFKTKVEKFYLFFDVKFSLFKKKIGDTEYGIGWLPLGGYVKIAGMIDESMDTEQMKQEPQPWEFRSKPAWQRLIIMTGGVIVNFLLAWVIYTVLLFSNGDTYIPSDSLKYGIVVDSIGEQLGLRTGDQILMVDDKKTRKFNEAVLDIILGDEVTVKRDGREITVPLSDEGKETVFATQGKNFLGYRSKAIIAKVQPNSVAEKAGLMPGDEIKGVNGVDTQYWDEFRSKIGASANQKLDISVLRNGSTEHLELTVPDEGIIGIELDLTDLRVTDNYNFLEAIPAGFKRTIQVLTDQIRQFKVIFNTKTGAYKQVKGPIGIVELMSPTWDWVYFFNFMAMFSVWLAFLNILPIPALDGGHVMFLLYEIISGRKPSEKVLETGQIIGFVILMGLMAVVFGNDIWNIIKKFL
ncbi:RIP metalloprotease RseP [Arenibacter troitsensis]|uniref:Zinc metalloprotease n=1 Tax=Arenibacter troitsensis TaxID=188872 RepID=A0A1X7KTY7_9FLAO|nr:RIP metalloprotease RseP [Arenibacter troitsensis]MDX1760330.1 RIP metalloprotease RseP [Arenibacter algicola]SMG44879.1 regulator of sigma E protease [Arenibacter troitsensis]